MMESNGMKVVIAPDSFKESLSAREAAEAIQAGLEKVWPNGHFVKVPMADGGEGTVKALVDATGGQVIEKEVTGPLGRPVRAFYGMLGDGETAVIEMAAAAGLHLVPPSERRPTAATTYGVGELIRAALDRGARHLIIGLGGSATIDGGSGMVRALGARLSAKDGRTIEAGGAALEKLEAIDLSGLDRRIADVTVDLATDVTNPLTGEKGAATVFGPQKGADPKDIRKLDRALHHYADVVRRALGKEIDRVPGAGAAGGLGAGAIGFLDGRVRTGVELVIETVGLREKLTGAALVITGEGRIDGQTIYGKTPIGVARCAKQAGIPVIALAGSLSRDVRIVYDHGIDALFSIVPGAVSLDTSKKNARPFLERAAENIARLWSIAELGTPGSADPQRPIDV